MKLFNLSNEKQLINEEFHIYALKLPILPLTRKGKLICRFCTIGSLRRIPCAIERMLMPLNLFHQINARIKVPEQYDYIALRRRKKKSFQTGLAMQCALWQTCWHTQMET